MVFNSHKYVRSLCSYIPYEMIMRSTPHFMSNPERGHNFFLNVMNLIKFGLILNVNTSTPFYSWVCLILYSSSMVNSMGTNRISNDKHS